MTGTARAAAAIVAGGSSRHHHPRCSIPSLDRLYILCHGRSAGRIYRFGHHEHQHLKRPEPQALASAHRSAGGAVRQPADHLAGGARPARAYHDVAGVAAAGRGGDGAGDRGHPGRGADLRQARRSGDRVRHRHLAGGPGQRAGRRRLHRSARHEPGAGSSCRGPRLRDPARHHPQGAERASARSGRVLPDRSRRRCLARRHGLDARVRYQCGALRHHARQRAGAEGGARRRRDHHHRHARQEILRRLRPDASVRRRRGHARHHQRTHDQAARHSRNHRRRGVFVRDRARRLPGHDPGDPDRHSGRAHRTAQRRAGARLQRLFEIVAAGDAAAAAGISRQRERGRRAVEEFPRDRQGMRWRRFHLDHAAGGSHQALAGAARRLLGGQGAASRRRAWWRPTSACRSRGWPIASPKPKRI